MLWPAVPFEFLVATTSVLRTDSFIRSVFEDLDNGFLDEEEGEGERARLGSDGSDGAPAAPIAAASSSKKK